MKKTYVNIELGGDIESKPSGLYSFVSSCVRDDETQHFERFGGNIRWIWSGVTTQRSNNTMIKELKLRDS